jgi:hypothetical protein
METQTPTIQTERFVNLKHVSRYRILLDGKVTEDLGGIGFRSEERALNFWDSKQGLPIRGEGKAERRAAHLLRLAEQAAEQRAKAAAIAKANKKVLSLLDERSVWNREELKAAVASLSTR